MTIKDAIDHLQAIQQKYGDDIAIYFDCPSCGAVTAPDTIAAIREKTKVVLQHGPPRHEG